MSIYLASGEPSDVILMSFGLVIAMCFHIWILISPLEFMMHSGYEGCRQTQDISRLHSGCLALSSILPELESFIHASPIFLDAVSSD